MTSTLEKPPRTRRTARHDGRITPPVSAGVKKKLKRNSAGGPSLLQAWLMLREITIPDVAVAAGVSPVTIYTLIEHPAKARLSTLEAIASVLPGGLAAEQVRALACKRVADPDRVSEEIAEATSLQ